MPLLHLLIWCLAGAVLANAVPHSVSGVQGRRFQTPFAKPPGVGLSSSRTNVMWGFGNLAAGWALLSQIGEFDIRRWPDAAALGLGMFVMAFLLSGHFGRLHGGTTPDQ